MINAKIILDSVSPEGVRLTTLAVTLPKAILAQFNKHRMLSNSFMSSRAVPVATMLKRVQEEPFIPVHWGKNQRGMQADEECNEPIGYSWLDMENSHGEDAVERFENAEWTTRYMTREFAWQEAATNARNSAKLFSDAGYHKQVANRLLEPFSYTVGVVTATEWDNFFNLRLGHAAQPEFQLLAQKMKEAMDASLKDGVTYLEHGEWHLPFITHEDEVALFGMPQGGEGNLQWIGETLKKLSVARCARISYGLNERTVSHSVEDDLRLYEILLEEKHFSAFEHACTPMQTENYWFYTPWEAGISHQDRKGDYWSGNMRGWRQYRKILEDQVA